MQTRMDPKRVATTRRGRRRRLAVGTLGVLVAVALPAQAVAGDISGTVRDTLGLPVSNIDVFAYGVDLPTYGGATRSDGTYDIPYLPAGSFRVWFSAAQSDQNYLPQYYNGKPSADQADLVTVAQDQTASGIDAHLAPGGQITGTVTDQGGHPLAAVTVTASQDTTNTTGVQVQTTTDAGGNYHTSGLPTGSYEMGFSTRESGANYVDQRSAHPVSVTAPATTAGVNAQLAPGAEIAGMVRAEDSSPLGGARVTLYRQSFGTDTATSDANGQYLFNRLAAGTYHVEFDTSGYPTQFFSLRPSLYAADDLSLGTGETRSNVDALMAPGGQIAGTVTDTAGQPLWASIELFTADTARPTGVGAFDGSDGRYSTPAVTPGRYLVAFWGSLTPDYRPFAPSSPQFYDLQDNLASATPVVVRPGQITGGIDARIARPASNPPAAHPGAAPNTPRPQTARLVLTRRRLAVRSGTVIVSVACDAPRACLGTIEIRTERGRRPQAGAASRPALVGRQPYTVRAGTTASVIVHITRRGLRLLRTSRRGLRARIVLLASNSTRAVAPALTVRLL